jgi:hypothetical protein
LFTLLIFHPTPALPEGEGEEKWFIIRFLSILNFSIILILNPFIIPPLYSPYPSGRAGVG